MYYKDLKNFIITFLPKIPVYNYHFNLYENTEKNIFRFLIFSNFNQFVFTIYYDKKNDFFQICKVFPPALVVSDTTLDFIVISNSPLPLHEKNGKILPDYLYISKLLLHLPSQK